VASLLKIEYVYVVSGKNKLHGLSVQAVYSNVVHELTFLAVTLKQYFSSNKIVTLFRAK
jgi:hypothetical protein